MAKLSPVPSLRKFATVAVSAGLLAGATPGAAFAGDPPEAKPLKCDPAVEVCKDGRGRKNG